MLVVSLFLLGVISYSYSFWLISGDMVVPWPKDHLLK